jgi:hypothetical protein
MANEYNIPATYDTMVLTTTLADYQKRLVDNAYNRSVILKMLNGGDTKRMIDGGTSIN